MTSRSLLPTFPAALLLACAPVPELGPGTYEIEGGQGTLWLGEGSPGQEFRLEIAAPGVPPCTLAGQTRGGSASLRDADGPTCVLRFAKDGDRIAVSSPTPEQCGFYCGGGARFEGSFRRR